jgi:bifunctional UDP-N-acetylglucosamine pyrophosphorylase/glucosamine-1-phosphate N-acetyltransferase
MSAAVRAIVLAAGRGTRMRSARPKVLHELCGKPMLWYVLRALHDANVDDVTVVTNPDVLPHVAAVADDAGHARVVAILQEPQLGTGHAVSVALAGLPSRDAATLIVLNGDMPLVDAELVRRAIEARLEALSLVTARMPLPSAFGRIVRAGAHVERIVEARDATDDELAIDEMNAGLYAFDEAKLRRAIAELRPDNAQNEYYLTDTVRHLAAGGERIVPVVASDYRSVLGVNDRVELSRASAEINRRLCEGHMRAGVTIADPATTYLEPGIELAADVTLFPNTTVGGASSIGAHSEVGPNSRLYNARIGEHTTVTDSVVIDSSVGDFALVGPWTHLRGKTDIGTASRIGNFVEIKASLVAPGARIVHLAYVGDASVGERSNIGAGTITCNYDGVRKNRTTIGKDVFVGSNSSLVAPLTIGDGASTGAGAVVIRDVAPGERVVGNPARLLPPKP